MARTRAQRRGRESGNKTPVPNPNARKRNSTTSKPNVEVELSKLANKPGKLTREDITCAICWSILYEPTTLPCNHSLCEACFRKHIDETSLTCPCCRCRLSIWCRKAMKDNTLRDQKLWDRIQSEFPRLVNARRNGEDSQDLLEDELPSISSHSTSERGLDESPIRIMDGTICEESGQIASELQHMMEVHEKDLELERMREEMESTNLIEQIQEEERVLNQTVIDFEEQDFLIAQRLEKELIAQDMSNSSTSSNMHSTTKTPKRNLMNEWMASSSPNSIPLPGSSGSTIKSSQNQKASHRKRQVNDIKRNVKPKTKNKPATAPSSQITKASQNVMSKFLSQSMASDISDGNSPMSSFSIADRVQDFSKSMSIGYNKRYSAFSPTKASFKPGLCVLSSPEMPLLTPWDWDMSSTRSVKAEDSANTKTPDSINSEFDRHFKPIRSAPKTPPRRRPDGTFLPEPIVVKTTPVKANIVTSVVAFSSSSFEPNFDVIKPSCATIEKRISNDSGRASDDSRSPYIEISPTSFTGSDTIASSNTNAQSEQSDRGCTSDDYRVTPDYDVNSRKRYIACDEKSLSNKKLKIKPAIPDSMPGTSSATVKQEPSSPSLLDNDFNVSERVKLEPSSPSLLDNDCNVSESVKLEPSSPSLLDDSFNFCEIIKVEGGNYNPELESQFLESCRLKAEQEAADRAFAEQLQKSFDRGINNPRGRLSTEKYSLRSWLKPKVKVKEELPDISQ